MQLPSMESVSHIIRLGAVFCAATLLNITARAETFNIQIGAVVSDNTPAAGAGRLASPSEIDIYHFPATAGQLAFFEEISASAAFEGALQWRLIAPSGSSVFWEEFDSTSPGRVELQETGTYEIRVFVWAGKPSYFGNYTFAVRPIPPDASFAIAIDDTVAAGQPKAGAGRIAVAGERDLYTFQATAGQSVLFEELGVSDAFSGWLHWEVISPTGKTVLVDPFDLVNAGRLDLPETGIYTIKMQSGRADTGDVGDYSFRLRAIPADQEFSIKTGDTVSSGVPGAGAGRIEMEGARDIYHFQGSAGRSVFFEDLGAAAAFGGSLHLRLVSPEGTTLFVDPFDEVNPGRVDLPETGIYTVKVQSARTDTGDVGDYSFRLRAIPADQEFSINTGDTVSSGVPGAGAGRIEMEGGRDIYHFQGSAGEAVFFEDLGAATAFGGSLHLYVVSPAGTPLFVDPFDEVNPGRLDLTETGTYTIKVQSARTDTGDVGDYSFGLRAIADQEFSIKTGDMVSSGVPVAGAGRIEMEGARDIYHFQGSAGQAVFFEDLGAAAAFGGSLHLRVVSPGGTTLFVDSFDEVNPGKLDLPETGTYTIKVQSARTDTGDVGDYSFRISEIAGDTRYPLTIGHVVSAGVPAAGAGTIESGGGEDQYRFTGVMGQKVILEEISSAGTFGTWLKWELKKPAGTVIAESFFDSEHNTTVVLPETGTYTVRVYSGQLNSTQTGDYSFRVFSPVVALPDLLAADEGTPVVAPLSRFLSNDTYETGDTLTFDLPLTQTSQGATVIAGPDSVTYTPKAGFTGSDSFTYRIRGAFGGMATAVVSVQVKQVQGSIHLPAPLYFEDFENVAEGALPNGWRVRNFTDQDTPGMDLNDPHSDSYRDWVVISRDRVIAIGNAGSWDAERRLRVKPGQFVNGKEVVNLAEGKFAYAGSDMRAGSQVQHLFSPDFDLTGKRNVFLSFNSIYEQNQDSIGAVEYSIDGGVSWWPVVYMLDRDVIGPDALTTFAQGHDDTATYIDPATGTKVGGHYGSYIACQMWPILGPYISPRINDDDQESKRVELFRLQMADDQPRVRFRFTQAGTDSWYFGIDNFGLYSLPPVAPPVITMAPQSQMVAPGSSATLRVVATGADLTYEWRFNGTPIRKDTDAIVIIGEWQNSGVYQVVVSNAGGQVAAAATILVSSGTITADPKPMPTEPDNPSFEQGLTGWGGTGNAFSRQPTLGNNITAGRVRALKQHLAASVGGDYWEKLTYPIGHRGNYWVGTAEDRPSVDTVLGSSYAEDRTGTMYSRMFQVSYPYMSFLIGGTEDIDSLRVELLVEVEVGTAGAVPVAGRWYAIADVATGHNQEIMRRVAWDISAYIGKRAYIRIQDYSPTGHINVDDFQFSNRNPYTTRVYVGLSEVAPVVEHNGYYYDWDSPVWGLADLHTHPMSYLGFGGKLMHGRPDGSIAEALSDCNPDHGGFGLDNPQGDYYRELIMKVMENGNNPHREGYHVESLKQFRNWPVFSTISHQQMWHEWIRRSYDGGLRVMVALCVNNQLLARASKGSLAQDDKTVGDNQIQAMKDFAARHSDFMEIAYDPFQMREIIRRDKLAIILGSELDDMGNFAKDRVASEDLMRVEIQRLYDAGIRYIFPVHLTDNQLAGTAVGETILDIANKYVNGVAFRLEASAPEDFINTKLGDLEYADEAIAVGIAGAAFGPMLPMMAVPILDLVALSHPAGGAGIGVASALLPVAIIAAGNQVLLNAVGIGPIPGEVWPIGGNYPPMPPVGDEQGHKNQRGLQPLGTFAIREMMRRGMMIDIDHMSQKTLTNVFLLAEGVPGRYPLNSGHNSPRRIGRERNENHRTDLDYLKISTLGGLIGVGVENSDVFDVTSGTAQINSISRIPNDCAGTSKTFGQNYLYAFEKMQGRSLAIGTDADGFIPGPGPRFGPQSAYAIKDIDRLEPWKHDQANRADQISAQPTNGVLYTPRDGKPLTAPAFVGPAVDPDVDFEFVPRHDLGYAYNQDQRDFFAALKIFFYNRQVDEQVLKDIEGALSDSYGNKRRVRDYARGLVKGVKNEGPGFDFGSPDTIAREIIAKAVYENKVLSKAPPFEVVSHPLTNLRYTLQCKVWDDYQKAFGNNTPMKACRTLSREWDYNFEGMAHYGLLPDFFQDLKNVGLQPQDMSPLFNSAEAFASMWTKCIRASAEFNRPNITPLFPKVVVNTIALRWFADTLDVLETTSDLADPNSWQTVPTGTDQNGYKQVDVTVDTAKPPQYFRVRKQP